MQVICVVGALQPVRYGEIEAAFGDVSSSTLSTRLRELTDADLLEREQHDTIPPRVEYALTAARNSANCSSRYCAGLRTGTRRCSSPAATAVG